MSATKKRNLRKKIIACFCIAAVAAGMIAAPITPSMPDMSITASA
ncbi:MAG: hypothetical protein ACI4J6_04555 [Oscillospiraceae bacterium]